MWDKQNLREFFRALVTPPPYRIFCGKLQKLTPSQFVNLVAKLLQEMGGVITPSAKGADEAIDLLLKVDEGEEYIVQCKKWKEK